MTISAEKINQLLQKLDIEGLIESGAPRDEYFSEAKNVALALNDLAEDQYNEQNIISIISLVWARSFNLDSNGLNQRMTAIQNLAKEILKN